MKKLPIDVSSFKVMMQDDYLYVDKTKQIYELITTGRFYFLSRPRRFGKSLFLSTLKELFLGNKQLFNDLWINKSSYGWQEYPVIHLNFSDLDIETSQELKISLSWTLEDIAQSYGIDISSAPSAGTKLKMLVKELSKKNKVVILIDEYDYPLLNNLESMHIAKANRRTLRNFFSVIKSLDEYLRAIFFTGITKFSKASIFSGLNNLNDISFKPEAASLLGYTKEEINSYFETYIDSIATQKDTSKETVLSNLQTWYNGYRFSEKEVKVYNPFSVLYFLRDKDLRNYWFESGTPSFLIELLKTQFIELNSLEKAEFSDLSLGAFDLEDIPLITLLFQTGYLTIVNYDPVQRKYKLGWPNLEVEISFKKYLLSMFAKLSMPAVENKLAIIKQALDENNIDNFCLAFKSFLANIPYQIQIEQEGYYHSLLQLAGTIIGKLLGFKADSEVATDKGRIDFVISTEKFIYIFELKLNRTADIALKQIEDNRYYERYLLDSKTIVLVGMTFKKVGKHLDLECKSKLLIV